MRLAGNSVYLVQFGGGGAIIFDRAELAVEHAKHHTPDNAKVEGYDPDVSVSIFYYAEWGDGEWVVVQQQQVHEK